MMDSTFNTYKSWRFNKFGLFQCGQSAVQQTMSSLFQAWCMHLLSGFSINFSLLLLQRHGACICWKENKFEKTSIAKNIIQNSCKSLTSGYCKCQVETFFCLNTIFVLFPSISYKLISTSFQFQACFQLHLEWWR
jgi:hypothetical protein